jgi:ubiquinone biosynthesis protein
LDLKKDIKDIRRFKEIVLVFFEEGLGYYLAKTKFKRHLPFMKRFLVHKHINNKEVQAYKLRRAFERLGPTFVKLGQLLSLRPDLVPKEFSKEFEKLQDEVQPFSYSEAKKTIEEELKKPIDNLFKSFDKKPIASASIAQVHKAVLKNGKVVAVKVQRPNIKEMIDEDLDILFFIAKEIEKHFSKLRNYRPVDVVKEFALWTRREIDFEIEARNATRLKEELKNDSSVDVPKVYSDLSSKKVLIMDFVSGVRIDNYKFLKKAHINRKNLSLIYFNSVLEQALLYGFFHADPHPGNILVKKNGKMVYIDFGIMGEVRPQDMQKVVKFISTIPDKDPVKSFNILLSLSREIKTNDISDFREKCIQVMEDVYFHSIGEVSFGHALYEIISEGAKYGVIFDANHVMLAKAVYQAEGLGYQLDPNFKVAEVFKIFTDKFLKEKYSVGKIVKKVKDTFWKNKDLLLELPEHIVKIINKLEQDEKPQQFDTHKLEEIEHELVDQQHKRSVGFAFLVLFLASIFLLYIEGHNTLFGLPLSVILISVTGLLFLYFIFSHRKNGEVD